MRGKNAATQAPERVPYESDYDSNYESSNKSSPSQQRAIRLEDVEATNTAPSVDNAHICETPKIKSFTKESEGMQRATERCSLMLIVPALVSLIVCPTFLLFIFTFPSASSGAIAYLLAVGAPLALVVLLLGCLLGNVVWYSADGGKLKFFVHCGNPRHQKHIWGDSLFAKAKEVV